MRISEIRVDGLRNLRQVELDVGPTLNLLLGRNGAGKTSLLEAVHLLAHGRSFRSGQIDSLVRHDAAGFSVFARLNDATASNQTLGMARAAAGWQLRQNGLPIATLVDFVRTLAVVTLEPESHQLLTGTAESRRRYLDWLLFHVEPDFLGVWRRYLRALRQRNAALRSGAASDATLGAWDIELAQSGERIDLYRKRLLDELHDEIRQVQALLQPDLAVQALRYRAGWPTGLSLLEALAQGRGGDRERGFTQRGPHRSDWRLEFGDGLSQAQLSRGQGKLAATACLLAQASHYHGRSGSWPIISCDDLASELDGAHQLALMQWLSASGAQLFISATEWPAAWQPHVPATATRFHVEQGRITPLL